MKGLSFSTGKSVRGRERETGREKGEHTYDRRESPVGGRNDRVKVNEEKGIEKECPREGRIRTRARERVRRSCTMGYSQRGGREGAKRRLE